MPFEVIHSDLWTSSILSFFQHKYYVLYLDNFSNFLWTFPIPFKFHVFPTFSKFASYVNTQFNCQIKNLQCDNGEECANDHFFTLCAKMVSFFRFSFPIHLVKMVESNVKFDLSTTSCVPFLLMLFSHRFFGIVHLAWLHIF